MVDVTPLTAGSVTAAAYPNAVEAPPAGAGGTSGPARPRAPAVPRRQRGRFGARPLVALLFLAPALLLLGALVVYPIVATIVASLRDATCWPAA